MVWFWCKFGATLYATILTIFTISNGIAKTPRDNFDQRSKLAKNARRMLGVFCYLLENNELPYRSWIGLRHELNLRFVNCLRHWRNRAIQFMKSKISNHEAARLQFMTACRQFITFPAVLFTFYMFYGIIISGNYLLDKLEYVDYFLRRRQSVYCI